MPKSALQTPGNSIRRRLEALLDAGFAASLLVTWFSPALLGEGMLGLAVATFLIEFLAIHSAAFMGGAFTVDATPRGRLRTLTVIALAYLLLAAGLTAAAGQWGALIAFALLLWGRVAAAWPLSPVDPERDVRTGQALLTDWVNSLVLYIAWVFAGVMLPWPAIGLTPEAIAAASVPGSGEWVERPQSLLAAGAGYFLSRAWMQWRGRPFITVEGIRAINRRASK